MSESSPFVVSPEWLFKGLEQKDISIVDARWYLATMNKNAFAEYQVHHIPGSVFFDQDKIADLTTGLPHSLPNSDFFAESVSQLGISEKDVIIIYDDLGYFSAPRVWWMFKIMGAQNVFVLDGGLQAWKKADYPVTSEKTIKPIKQFNVHFHHEKVVSLQEMRKIVSHGEMQIADARGRGRFTGDEPEPRQGIRSGHMPHARNVPFSVLSKSGKLLSLDQIKEQFLNAGIDPEKPVVTSCGSGVTAAVVTLALESLGNKNIRLYDGSWSEWGALSDTPIEIGDAQ